MAAGSLLTEIAIGQATHLTLTLNPWYKFWHWMIPVFVSMYLYVKLPDVDLALKISLQSSLKGSGLGFPMSPVKRCHRALPTVHT